MLNKKNGEDNLHRFFMLWVIYSGNLDYIAHRN